MAARIFGTARREAVVPLALIAFLGCHTALSAAEPVFHLSFDQGLKPDTGPAEPCQWAAPWSGLATHRAYRLPTR